MFALVDARKFSGLYLTYIENNEKFTISYRLSCPDIYVDIIALPARACIASLRSRC